MACLPAVPTADKCFYLVNAANGAFLDAHADLVQVWNGGGKRPADVIASNHGAHVANLWWRAVPCPHDATTVYIVSVNHGSFLDTHGDGHLSLWDGPNAESTIDSVIQGNTSSSAGNLRWELRLCAADGSFHVANRRHQSLLGVVHIMGAGECGKVTTVGSSGGSVGDLIRTRGPSDAHWRWHFVELPTQPVRILHLSDTHNLHQSIEAAPRAYALPKADILVHTGDMTNSGTAGELADFNRFLGTLRASGRFKHIVVILGNHEWRGMKDEEPQPERDRLRDAALDPGYAKRALSNATHVLEHESVVLEGIRFFGSTWCPWQRVSAPDEAGESAVKRTVRAHHPRGGQPHRFGEIEPCDVLLTHGPACGPPGGRALVVRDWGASRALYDAILRAGPRCHLFGHLHEDRGYLYRRSSKRGLGYKGGNEYRGAPWGPARRPAAAYPCDVISNNAMKNHPGMEAVGGVKAAPCIAGRGRVIAAWRPPPQLAGAGAAGVGARAAWRFFVLGSY